MEKIPYSLVTARIDRILNDYIFTLNNLLPNDMSLALYNEMRSVQEAFRMCKQYTQILKDREPFPVSVRVAVYNACALFIYNGSYDEVVEKDENVVDEKFVEQGPIAKLGTIFYKLKSFMEEYPPKSYELRWFACAMCGHECQLYEPKEGSPAEFTEKDTLAVHEFKHISHVCDKCWQHYVNTEE